jgi:hypothetical protein
MAKKPRSSGLTWPSDHSNELTHAHYAAIGRVASEWAAFETTIDSRAIALAGLSPELAVCFTAQIAGWTRKLDAYISIARLCGMVKAQSKLNIFAKDTQGLAEQRNRIVHDPWVGTTRPHRLEATARKKLRLEFIEMPTAEVSAFASKITEHINRLDDLADEILAEIKTLREKPPSASL